MKWTKMVPLLKSDWLRLVELVTRYNFQSPREAVEFLLDLAESQRNLEKKIEAWKRKRGLA